ncbi:MAG: HAD family phosphatase [Clostridiales bacterium]|nr:HAD family phosphatase [bacterium 210917-SL.2.15]MCI5843806.1 HAD family phosphatase [Clostridiales bacterium]MDY4035917.1 HAD family phosphatase [Candidatus Pseudoscilispira sp.]
MLFFDLDGTLVDSSRIWLQIDLDFTARRGLPHTQEYHDFVAHTTAPVAAQFTKDYYHLSESAEEIMAEWYAQALKEYTHHIEAKPHVRAYLEQCLRQGESMAVLTSSAPELCRATLQRNNLASYFSNLFFAQEMGMEKREAALFRSAAQQCSAAPEECTLFDDSPVACRGAKEAGFRVVGVFDSIFAQDEDAMRRLCDAYIYDFSELLSSK